MNISVAQLSPGDLNSVHANLEGLKNCQVCHETGQQIAAAKCLDCHKLLKERISTGKGLHAAEGYGDCILCHVEHLGRSAELIIWPADMQTYDHSETGYKLEGRHAKLKCRQCHQAKNIVIIDRLKSEGRDPGKTFLGLDQDCLSCHKDEHRAQLAGTCLACHSFSGWRPAEKFNHNAAAFALTGKHIQVACKNCHPSVVDNKYPDDNEYSKFKGISYTGCNDCHEDIHRGRFNENCTQCHNTSGWKQTALAEFDHARTNFPLLGKHANLKCESCHPSGQALTGLKYSRCLDCHTDYHQGQFVSRASKGECSECHTESGFMPARFTIEMHQMTDFALTGGHLAIPCLACHKKLPTDSGLETIQFNFKSSRCFDCHNDPHAGEADKYAKTAGCEYCHNVESWRNITFGHSPTGFSLDGRHKEIACRACHQPVKSEISTHSLRFTDLKQTCETCHEDIHQGQFKKQIMVEGATALTTGCGRCHSSVDWFPAKFNHNRDTAFKLEGAHQAVRCEGCHEKINRDGRTFAWYKPIDTSCEHCHGSEISNKKRGDS